MRLERSRFVEDDLDDMAAYPRLTDEEKLAGHGMPDGLQVKNVSGNVSDDIPT
jgi:hypothetical protein